MQQHYQQFLDNIYDEDATNKTKLQQVSIFIKYLNEYRDSQGNPISMEEKVALTIKVLAKIKAQNDGYLKQLPYTSRTTAYATFLLIEMFFKKGYLDNRNRENFFILCDLTYGYGMHSYWVTDLIIRFMLDKGQSFISMYYDKYFLIDKYCDIQIAEGKEHKDVRVYFKANGDLLEGQSVILENYRFKYKTDIKIEFNGDKNLYTKNENLCSDLKDFATHINLAQTNTFYLKNSSNDIFEIDKEARTYKKLKKLKKFDYTVFENTIFDKNEFDNNLQSVLDVHQIISNAEKVEVGKLNLDYNIIGITKSKIDSFDFIDYNNLFYDTIQLSGHSNSVYILDLPANDIISQDSAIADKLISNICSFLSAIENNNQQIFIISTAKNKTDFERNSLWKSSYKGIVNLSGSFMPLTDTAMNLVVLSNKNIEEINIDISYDRIIDFETPDIFEKIKEIKQKCTILPIQNPDSKQYKFFNNINNLSYQDLYKQINTGKFIIFNDFLFEKTESDIKILGNILKIAKNEDEKKIIITILDHNYKEDKKEIHLECNFDNIVFHGNEIWYKKYSGDHCNMHYINPTKAEFELMYKNLIVKLAQGIQKNV